MKYLTDEQNKSLDRLIAEAGVYNVLRAIRQKLTKLDLNLSKVIKEL